MDNAATYKAMTKRKIYERDRVWIESIKDWEIYCSLCKEPMPYKKASIDHVIPRSRGGNNSLDNLKLAHRDCNSRKGNSMPSPSTKQSE